MKKINPIDPKDIGTVKHAMKLDRVTVTGADDTTAISEMIRLSNRFPFVEWGILVSASRENRNRFPSHRWIDDLFAITKNYPEMKFSCHVCGRWVREICLEGKIDPVLEQLWSHFQRIQLNFRSIVHKLDRNLFISSLSVFSDKQFIFQLDNINNEILDVAQSAGIDAVPLFDTSGGIGMLPLEWPDIRDKKGYYGYAGGLSPENLFDQLERIERVTGDNNIWIDAETYLRTNNGTIFDLGRVSTFLGVARGFTRT